ncbi:MAG: hypothetical protein KAR54_01810 [Candidatus Pacebacteria bacterium]|nr:hypothetical protein [Candidatus Paceibacterota bacterium]
MSTIILYHHLGLGDHVMCHGIVREYCKKYDKVLIFSKPHNYESVSFMFRDIPNLVIIKSDDTTINKFIRINTSKSEALKYDEAKILGFQYLDKENDIPLEWQFYQLAGIPLEKKWSSFFIKRDLEKEQTFFERIAPKKDYVFLHEDISRKYTINRKLINKDYIIFSPEIKFTDNFSDYCTIIEKAKEIHVIDSSFMFLIDCLPYNNPNQKLYIHRYARDNNEWQLPILKKDWRILITETSKLDPLKDFIMLFSRFKVPILRHSFFKRAVRKIFRIMNWSMIRRKKTDILALIRRYVPGKSFSTVSLNKDDLYISTAKSMGATKTTIIDLNILKKDDTADIVFYSNILFKDPNLINLLKKLHSVTNQILILNIIPISKKPNKKYIKNIESMFKQVGFEVREKHILPLDICFVCRVIPIK